MNRKTIADKQTPWGRLAARLQYLRLKIQYYELINGRGKAFSSRLIEFARQCQKRDNFQSVMAYHILIGSTTSQKESPQRDIAGKLIENWLSSYAAEFTWLDIEYGRKPAAWFSQRIDAILSSPQYDAWLIVRDQLQAINDELLTCSAPALRWYNQQLELSKLHYAQRSDRRSCMAYHELRGSTTDYEQSPIPDFSEPELNIVRWMTSRLEEMKRLFMK